MEKLKLSGGCMVVERTEKAGGVGQSKVNFGRAFDAVVIQWPERQRCI
jgi:hypothetical protein